MIFVTWAFIVNLHSVNSWMSRNFSQNRRDMHNHSAGKRTFDHLLKLACRAKWLSVCLRTKRLWIRIPLQSLNLDELLKLISPAFYMLCFVMKKTTKKPKKIQSLHIQYAIDGINEETWPHWFGVFFFFWGWQNTIKNSKNGHFLVSESLVLVEFLVKNGVWGLIVLSIDF